MSPRLKRRLIRTVLSLLLGALFLLAQQHGWVAGKLETAQPGLYSINHFVDGDTIAVNMNGATETVRFIGVDTPETHKPNTPVQCYGLAAAAFTKNTIGTQSVRLATDPDSTDRDRYNRLLRYVYLPDGRLLNKLLIEGGYGFYYPYFPFTKSDEFAAAQASAQASNKGLWGNCSPHRSGAGYKM
jgi:micrococcal nuclease